MNKIKRSGRLLKASFAVLFREKRLLLFPVIATVLAAVVALFFIAPIVFYPTGHPVFSTAHWTALVEMFARNMGPAEPRASHQPMLVSRYGPALFFSQHWWVAPIFALAYFVSMFLATFCNVAFYHEIMQALGGNTVSIRRGFRLAASRWRTVLLWSLFAGLVGYLIQTIQERLGFFGRIVTGLVGFVWSVACIFIIPTLVHDTETRSPIKLLQSSVGTLRQTWGEMIVGFVGIQLFSFLAMFTMIIGILLCLGIPMVVFSHPSPGLKIGHLMYYQASILLLFVIVATSFSFLGGLLNAVYRCALYIYATEGVVPGSFDKELLDSAWKVK
jgi:uncharacterized membrane protein YeaQ/YmgE (transglycosylase-associated protein family)